MIDEKMEDIPVNTNSKPNKLFTQVARTAANNSGADLLDPLSLFAVNNASTSKPLFEDEKIDEENISHSLLSDFDSSIIIDDDYDIPPITEENGSMPAFSNSITSIHSTDSLVKDEDQHSEDEVKIRLLTGEQKVMSIIDAYIQISPGNFISGTLFMTNYRLSFIPSGNELISIAQYNPSMYSWLNIPLACIEKIEKEKKSRDNNQPGINLVLSCKDLRQHRVTIRSKNASINNDQELDKALAAMQFYAFPNNMRYLFAFSHLNATNLSNPPSIFMSGDFSQLEYDLYEEYCRLGVNNYSHWRVSNVNNDYKLCNTYPKLLVVPRLISDDELFLVANFRSGQRLPSLCWIDGATGVSMWRSSQPKAGVSGSCLQDEKFLDLIAQSCPFNNSSPIIPTQSIKKMNSKLSQKSDVSILNIVDLRSRASAMANRAAGAGYESQNNYPNSRLEFYSIPNIHAMRDSLKGLMSVLLNPTAHPSTDINFSKQIEDTQWLSHLRLIIKSSWETAMFITKSTPVLVHCSHGWDRTAQVCSLAQIFLDPYYRTFDGFRVLVEKEWCSFGHPFQMRCAHGQDKADKDQMSPIFLQFLDSLWQVQKQSRQYFEFNARYILTIAENIYSCRFGTFLFSNDHDRDMFQSRTKCVDIWKYLELNRSLFTNPLYYQYSETSSKILLPPLHQLLRNVSLWSDYFLRWSSVTSIVSAPPAISNIFYKNGLSTPTYTDIIISENSKNKGTADSDVFAIITSDDFWEGAYRIEKETKICVTNEEIDDFSRHSDEKAKDLIIEDLVNIIKEKASDRISEDVLESILNRSGNKNNFSNNNNL